jgi:two-component system phosphate regulon sensor histidine kinase PhoR
MYQGYLETFLSQLGEQPPHLAKAMYRMLLQTQRMSELVNDFLTLLQLETSDQANNLQPIDIGQMLVELRQSAQELCNRQKKQQDIAIEIASDVWLVANEQEIFSAFSNLVYNAVKYTTETGTVSLRWWTDEAGGYFAVSDTGIGIAAHHLSRLTERFYRVDQSRARSSGGTGLGLAIVKHVLKRHHAHLKIQSTPGQGSVFTCHFPLQAIAKGQHD